MAADGTSRDHRKGAITKDGISWAKDPVVFRYQVFARGYGPRDRTTFLDRSFFDMPWAGRALKAVADVRKMTVSNRIEHNQRLEGPSRGGKTAILRKLIRENLPWRDGDGLHVPMGYIEMPSVPDYAGIGQKMLCALGDPSWKQHRSPIARLMRIAEVIEQVGAELIFVDDFHHLVDTRGDRVQHAAADFFKELGTEANVAFVFAGLSRMEHVFQANEQLRLRSDSVIRFPCLEWKYKKHGILLRKIIEAILETANGHLKHEIEVTDAFVFRIFCCIGGRIGNLFRVLAVAIRNCAVQKHPLDTSQIQRAVFRVMANRSAWPDGVDPFHARFSDDATAETLRAASKIAEGLGPSPMKPRANGGP